MNKYNVRHFWGKSEDCIEQYCSWVTTRKHITIVDVMNIKQEGDFLNIVVTYMEESYAG